MLFRKTVLIVSLFFSQVTFGCEITIRYERYGVENQAGEPARWHGLDVDFAKALLANTDCSYRFVELPWARALGGLKAGLIDLMLSVSKTAEREKYFYFIGPQRQETIVLAMNRENAFTINSLEDLLSLPAPVAVHRGAYYGETFEKLLQSNPEHFITVVDNKTKLDLLAHKKISGFLEEKGNLIYQKTFNPSFSHIYIDDFVINSTDVYYAFSKRSLNQAQLEQFERIFRSSEYQTKQHKILAKYGLE
ncbi:substrate-binding periplasmic protein [Pseudoalteromonas piratica]|uniref:substrate-binding periplasmic protein n=1 Tax=Pseudoalteromonas piratica TaxID=1348114 RepID=UPI0006899179|nr:transporter substrate-binding domain-containing protein [Pseudoalteromonas piratica]